MLDSKQMQERSKTFIYFLYVWFLRIMAFLCLVSGLVYWSQLVGLSGEGSLRFDLLEPHWRVLSTVLAVILPSAALGLWTTQAWGVVLWVIALLIEIAAFGAWSYLYGAKPMLVFGHILSLGFLAILALFLLFEKRSHHMRRL